MKRNIKKQFWLSTEEDARLKENARKTCLSESDYLRMLIRETTPQVQPNAEFYEMLQQMRLFTERLESLSFVLKRDGLPEGDELQKEIKNWHAFQLAIQQKILMPEKGSVIWR
ncbi:MAG: plasmid mobilization protein [Anaerovoracaceae bacterium]